MSTDMFIAGPPVCKCSYLHVKSHGRNAPNDLKSNSKRKLTFDLGDGVFSVLWFLLGGFPF